MYLGSIRQFPHCGPPPPDRSQWEGTSGLSVQVHLIPAQPIPYGVEIWKSASPSPSPSPSSSPSQKSKKKIKNLISHQGNLLDPCCNLSSICTRRGKNANLPPCKLGNLGDSFSLVHFRIGVFVAVSWEHFLESPGRGIFMI